MLLLCFVTHNKEARSFAYNMKNVIILALLVYV